MKKKLLLVVNVDWFFMSHRLAIALGAINEGYEVHIATEITKHLSEMESYGLIVHPLSIHRTDRGVFNTLKLVHEIYQICYTVQPDVLHIVTLKLVLLAGIAGRLAKVPSMVSAISGLGFLFVNNGAKAQFIRTILSQLYRFSLGHPNLRAIVQNSDDLATIQKLAKLPDSSFKLLPGSGVDLQKYCPEPEPSGTPVVLMASRMLIDKGVLEFIDAARRLKTKGFLVRFLLVGDPDPANPASLTKIQLEHWHQEGIVEWWGHQQDMSQVFAKSNLVVLPSYGEGFPKVLIEAAACGRAIVTTQVTGCRDAIEPDVTGLLVPVKDANSLANAIETLIIDPDLRMSMASSGRKRAEILFPVEKIVTAHLEIYRQLISSSTITDG
jgi:glycosyltransferase involved in cell wall biosynthesis